MKLLVRLFVSLTLPWVGRVYATGYYGPDYYLGNGGENVTNAPEFYWDLEVERIARDFHAPEKLAPAIPVQENPDASIDKPRERMTAEADVADFAAALKEGKIKPTDASKAAEEHEAARRQIASTNEQSSAALPEEFASEFADYHRGAYAFRLGKAHWEEARNAWLALLGRPAAERHYRTVWAAFMLGKLALKSGEPEAVKFFERTRAFAAQGFSDSLGMAADSYGWQGRSEWKQGHPEKAAPLFLTQLSLGDESAVVSLKALIPDRTPVDGMLNYGPEVDERNSWSDEQKSAEQKREEGALKMAAQDPLLRRLVTAHILATQSVASFYGEDTSAIAGRSTRWLGVIKDAKLEDVPDAEYLGWAAYGDGDYKEAARWLALAKPDSPAGAWLRAKLELRAGKLREAAVSMAKAWASIHDPAVYTGWTAREADEFEDYGTAREGPSWPLNEEASGDLAALHLVRADFVQALDIFLKGGLWTDTAFVAERVLTADELIKYVDQLAAAPNEEKETPADVSKLRYLLGRRLVREDRYDAAAKYLLPPFDKILARYAAALRAGADEKLAKVERAEAWFRAAWLARYDGMELMGTEVAPDGFISEGAFEITDLAQQRLAEKYQEVRFVDGQEKTTMVPIKLKPSKEELQRLSANKIVPDGRYHYRYIAAALAMKAAALLPDNSEELADVINMAGQWVKDRDEKLAGKYFNVLERRAGRTEIGRAANAKHWFVGKAGSWSAEQAKEYDAMHEEIGLPKAEN